MLIIFIKNVDKMWILFVYIFYINVYYYRGEKTI